MTQQHSFHTDLIDPLLTVADLARWLNKPKSWVYSNVSSLPAFYVGRGLRFRRADVEAWFEATRVTGVYDVR